ncbi:MAG: hypothetical protein GXW99_07805 [Clostridiales bacterium]|nr:hypothetical protein [Clostridiales bacterium]
MACFVVPAVEAIVIAAAAKSAQVKEEKARLNGGETFTVREKIPLSRKLKWLRNMLLGGSALLAFEHVWHGEITAWFPFLTAAGNPADTAEMLHEMATVGVAMAVLVTAVWGCMLLVTDAIEKRTAKTPSGVN